MTVFYDTCVMRHTGSDSIFRRRPRVITILAATIIVMVLPCLLNAINAAPNVADFPGHLLSLPDEMLLQKARQYQSSEHPDSALLCYMIVAQREFDSSSPKRIHQGLSARYEAGALYYSPFYDYGKAYSLFQDTYSLAKECGNNEFMGLAANTIGNILSVYNSVSYSEGRMREIIDWYNRSVEQLIDAGMVSDAIPTLHNMMAMAMDTTLLKFMTPTFKRYKTLPQTDTIPGNDYTIKRIAGYLKIGEGKPAEAVSLFHAMLAEKGGVADTHEAKIWGYFDLASLHWLLGRTDSAVFYVKKAKQVAEDNEMYEVLPGTDLMEADIYSQIGDADKYKEAMLRYYSNKDSLMNLSTISLFSEPHLKKTIADIDVQLVRAKTETRIRNLIILFVCLLLVVSVAFAAVVLKKNKTLNHKNRNLIEKVSIIEKQDKIILRKTISEMKRSHQDDSPSPEDRHGNPELLSKIVDIMEHSREIYDPEFSIDVLARLCGEKTKVVSAELNNSLSKNFSALLNEYRVREMCRRLSNPDTSSMTIEAIAQEVGYKSRSTYINAFKKYTGLTPSEYVKASPKVAQLNDEISENAD